MSVEVNTENVTVQNTEQEPILIRFGNYTVYEGNNIFVKGAMTLVGAGAGVGAIVGAVGVPVYACYYAGKTVENYAFPVLGNLWTRFVSR